MKQLSIFILLVIQINGLAQTRCFSDERRQLFSQQTVPQTISAVEPLQLSNRTVLTIPVVVHVVWNTVEENLPDEQIISQIEVLNEDFRALNGEVNGVPNNFAAVLADVELEFCLARQDPDGEETDGINRVFTNQTVFSSVQNRIFFEAQGGANAWQTTDYLNIWVCDLGGNIGGFAAFPGQASPEEDGVVVHYENFGRVGVEPPYHLGRTLTHEIGHFLNLEHVWQGCGADDGVADTPLSSKSYLNECPDFGDFTCGSEDMFMNFMNFTDDACMAMFTEGQKSRIMDALFNQRAGLLESKACLLVSTKESSEEIEFSVFPNPTENTLWLQTNLGRDQINRIQFFDSTGRLQKELPFEERISLEGLPSGLYHMRIGFRDNYVVRKVLKM